MSKEARGLSLRPFFGGFCQAPAEHHPGGHRAPAHLEAGGHRAQPVRIGRHTAILDGGPLGELHARQSGGVGNGQPAVLAALADKAAEQLPRGAW